MVFSSSLEHLKTVLEYQRLKTFIILINISEVYCIHHQYWHWKKKQAIKTFFSTKSKCIYCLSLFKINKISWDKVINFDHFNRYFSRLLEPSSVLTPNTTSCKNLCATFRQTELKIYMACLCLKLIKLVEII